MKKLFIPIFALLLMGCEDEMRKEILSIIAAQGGAGSSPPSSYSYTAYPTDHPKGADFTVVFSTDQLDFNSFDIGEYAAIKNGLRINLFDNPDTAPNGAPTAWPAGFIKRADREQMGAVVPDLYFSAELVAGQGLATVLNRERSAFEAIYSKDLTTISYRSGIDTEAPNLLNDILMGRNSLPTGGVLGSTQYGISKRPGNAALGTGSEDMSHAGIAALPSTRRFDGTIDATDLTGIVDGINDARNNNGLARFFYHFHDAPDLANLLSFINQIGASSIAGNYYSCGYGEAFGYMLLRDAFVSCEATDSGSDVVLDITMGSLGTVNQNLLIYPITIEVDLTGSVLEGQGISGGNGIQSLGSDRYLIDVDFAGNVASKQVALSPTGSPTYIDTSNPVVSLSEVGGVATATTNIATRAGLWYSPNGGSEKDVRLIARSTTLGTNHIFDLNTATINYAIPGLTLGTLAGSTLYVAAVSEYGRGGADSVNFSQGANQPPVIDNVVPDQSLSLTTTYQIPINTASDPEGGTLYYSMTMADDSPLPIGWTFDAGTRTLTVPQMGSFDVKLIVADQPFT